MSSAVPLHCAASLYISLSVVVWMSLASALYVEPIRIPAAVKSGDSYTLQCRYTLLAGQTLYAIRWYRNDTEIVRYMPKEMPPHLVHYNELNGIEIDKNSLREGNVTLVHLKLGASGRYRCEVSLDEPTFETYEQEANLTVIELPRGKTHMDLSKGTLHAHEPISANCSGPHVSHLVPDIVWYLDSHPIPNDGRFVTRLVYNDSAFDEYRRVRSLLHLPSDWLRAYIERHRKHQMHSKEQYYVVQLKCTSTVAGIYEDSDAFDVKIHKAHAGQRVTNAPVHQRGVGGSAKSFSSCAIASAASGWMTVMYILKVLAIVAFLS